MEEVLFWTYMLFFKSQREHPGFWLALNWLTTCPKHKGLAC